MDEDLFDAFSEPSSTSTKRKANSLIDAEDSRRVSKSKLEIVQPAIQPAVDIAVPSSISVAEIETVSSTAAAKEPFVPAKVYPFVLDTFQQEAVGYIERGESVLVAAHTSAGKTAVAEYAIAKSLKNGQRVIYTSPIKALSNQKYRDLQEEFHDVGLMTGDMTMNPHATCLIMTTEILRSMLYRGSEVMREVAWVIYDEVHYMRDKERGVVWEESIILLPHKVRFVFLSATIPNAKEFVGWVSKIHHQPCHVVYTDYRPVPLQHFVFPTGADGLYLVVDEKGKFREDNFQKAMSHLQGPSELEESTAKKKPKKTSNQGAELFKIVKLVMEREIDPVIVFSFSKKSCESYALQMAKLDFNNSEEKELVEHVFMNAMEALSEEDRTLPQVVTILPLLKRGVGIHHGGLLPILKEVIEILFQEGLIKCLFATETFSIGINMPARTVVFTSTRKFDGQDFRWITSGEYIQMSGRAGRRGKDDRGIVIQMLGEKMDPDACKDMIYGASDPLYSSYHVSYNMVLNMLRVEDADPENLLRSSFHQYQQEQEAPALEIRAVELQREASLVLVGTPDEEEAAADYLSLSNLLEKTKDEILQVTRSPDHIRPFLNPGRLFYVQFAGVRWGWGVLVACKELDPAQTVEGTTIGFETVTTGSTAANSRLALHIVLQVEKTKAGISAANSSLTLEEEQKLSSEGKLVAEVLVVSLDAIRGVSQIRLELPRDITKDTVRRNLFKSVREIKRRFKVNELGDGLPLLNPVTDMGITSSTFKILLDREIELDSRLQANRLVSLPNKQEILNAFSQKAALMEEARLQRQTAKDSQTLAMKDELRKRKRVLKKLGYITAAGVLTLKGRFSCELSTGDELVLTDMIFEGVFNDLSIEQSVAILSCFVHKEAQEEASTLKIKPNLVDAFRKLQAIARTVAKVSAEALLTCDEEEYVKSFNPGLMDVAYAWTTGAKFVDICKLTEIFEGSIIRALRRLEELLRQLASAATSIGNVELKEMFESGADKIRRGVVFAASLYL